MTKKENTLRTDTELEVTPVENLEECCDADAKTLAPQTDLSNDNSDKNLLDGPAKLSEDTPLYHTDFENDGKPSPSAPESFNFESEGEENKQNPNESDTEAKEVPEKLKGKVKAKRRVLKPVQTVVTIDDERVVETDDDRAKNDLIDLIESMKSGRILSGSIQGVELTRDDAVAVTYHGAYKVIIPSREAVIPPVDYRDQKPIDVHQYMLTKRLGAEVDYIVKGIDSDAKIAVASRLDAMRAKRKHYYFGFDREGNNLLYPGICAEARVVSAIRAGIFIDLFGLEVYIPLRELSYQRMMDATVYFQPGQRILVRIMEVDRTDKNAPKAIASVKRAGENPYANALKRYTVGNRYVGSVSMVDTNGVFVALDGGIDCLCSYPKRGRPPRGARVTVRILGINHDTNRIWGAITHIAIPQ